MADRRGAESNCDAAMGLIVAPSGWMLRYGGPMASARQRDAARLRARRRRPRSYLDRHAGRIVLTALVSAVLLLTLLLTAFGTTSTQLVAAPLAESERPARWPPRASGRRLGRRASTPASDRAERGHRDRLSPGRRLGALARAGRTSGQRRAALEALAPPGGRARRSPRLVPAERQPRAGHIRAEHRRRSGNGRLLPRGRHGRRDLRLRDLESCPGRPDRRHGR